MTVRSASCNISGLAFQLFAQSLYFRHILSFFACEEFFDFLFLAQYLTQFPEPAVGLCYAVRGRVSYLRHAEVLLKRCAKIASQCRASLDSQCCLAGIAKGIDGGEWCYIVRLIAELTEPLTEYIAAPEVDNVYNVSAAGTELTFACQNYSKPWIADALFNGKYYFPPRELNDYRTITVDWFKAEISGNKLKVVFEANQTAEERPIQLTVTAGDCFYTFKFKQFAN